MMPSKNSFKGIKSPYSHKTEVKPLETYNLEYDPTFIYKAEGVKTVGYVPSKKGKLFEHSGKTIACGLDLGQQTESSIEKMGINRNSSLFTRFQPFLGKKYKTNPEIVAMPLEITADECKFICNSVIAWYYYCLKETIKNNKCEVEMFNMLSNGTKTALLSLYYHHGNFKMWRAKIIDCLKDNSMNVEEKQERIKQLFLDQAKEPRDNFKTRRKREAALIV